MESKPTWVGMSAVVTGAGAGIGAATAIKLGALDVSVTAATLVPDEGGEDVVEAITSGGGRAQLAFGDLSDELAVSQLIRTATGAFGPPDIVVHAAGGISRVAGIAELEAADWDRIVAINLRSAYLVMHAALPSMIERRWGRIVTVASEAGRMPTRIGSPAYAAAKAGVIGE
jgi:NAD(P)-dependent dehydrogenase (short-subunit alcohol dehydrogenase family)